MTKKIFWTNPYLTEFDTRIKTVHENKITLDETIFYAFSGGQESDSGTICGYPVLKAQKEEKEIFYTIDHHHKLKIGDQVKIVIDWNRRYKLMRLHFAAELILEIVKRKFHLEKVGAHISESKARIDLRSNNNISSIFEEILEDYHAIIKANRPIQTDFSDMTNQRRFWKIEDFAQVPCGGTHVKSTAEVGFVGLKRSHPGKGIERIEIRLLEDSSHN